MVTNLHNMIFWVNEYETNGVPNNLTLYFSQIAVGQRNWLSLFGDNYYTKDGTRERHGYWGHCYFEEETLKLFKEVVHKVDESTAARLFKRQKNLEPFMAIK